MSAPSTIRAFVLALLLALSFAAAGVGSASAGTLTASGGKVFYEADPGETDILTIDATSSAVRVRGNVTLTAPSGGGCFNTSPTDGTCVLSAAEIRLDLDDGNDEVDTVVSPTQGGVPLYVLAGTGADRIVGGKAADKVFGQPGADRLTGGDGGDRLEGDKDDDVLNGGPGNDFLEGDEGFTAGEDDLTGGTGFDTFQAGPGADVVHAIDGVANEPISCGLGFDTAAIDKFFDALGQLIASDDTSGCEHT
jgi:Ca2+-binding RTX toxin-like protein